MAFENNISTGMKKPRETGIKQPTIQKEASIPVINLDFLYFLNLYNH